MSLDRLTISVLMLTVVFVLFFASLAWLRKDGWLLNTTASAPRGFWRASPGELAVGDWVLIAPSPTLAAWLSARGYLDGDKLLLKRIAAKHPSRVCRSGNVVTIDSKVAAEALMTDRQGRFLPPWQGCLTLAKDQIFVLNRPAASLDSRYFGPFRRDQIVARMAPVSTEAMP